ncbi:MAG: gliding motility-associated C-terminal domain-containing protein [Saprospiraceae bacterium]|nr:gliding motility-associated C-terminal domain-containing protein [Saprospiraceae bacterium]
MTPATVTAPIGTAVNIQLKVTNFTNINSIQFPITYNSTVLKFDSIYNATLPGFTNGNYFVPSAGKVNVSWFADPGGYPNGYTAPANSSIFTLHFTVLIDGMANVNIANTAPGIEVIGNGQPITVDYQGGGSTVTGGSGSTPLQGFHIISNTIYIPQGETGCMPVTVHDFDEIISMQYAMHWDQTVLQFQNTQSYNLPDLTSASFGGDPANGLSLLAWSDPSAQGVTRADGTKIYDVCFTAVGDPGTSSLITINGDGFPPGTGTAEAFNAASQNVWQNNESGVTDTIFVITAPPPANGVTFTADKDTVGMGAQACIDVRVKNFDSIIAMQYGITYDATKLQFVSLTPNTNIPGLTMASFNTNTAGEIKFSWSDPAATGVSLPDSTILFTLCFTAAAPVGTKVDVKFVSLPGLPVEIVKEPDGPVVPVLNNGHVYISDVVPSVNIATTGACGGGNVGTATANVVNGTGNTYAWTGPNGFTGNTKTINNLATGTYNVTVTLVGGSTVTGSTMVQTSNISIPTPQLTITNVSCNGDADGAISLTVTGGVPNYSYAWSGPNNFTADTEDIADLGPGIYTLVVTDAANCTFTTQPYSISQPAVLNISLTSSQNVTCFNSSTGKAEVAVSGGNPNPALDYCWKAIPGTGCVSTAKNPDNLQVGTYNVTVTDIKGCTATLPNPVSITGPSSALSVATPIQKTNVTCYGANEGSISLSISGGWSGSYTVKWTPVYTGANLTNIPAGAYIPTITDQGGCTLQLAPIVINQPPAITPGPNPVVDSLNCFGDTDGKIDIAVEGGNGGPFLYAWGGPSGFTASTEDISNLIGGIYTLTVTDAISCTFVLPPFVIDEPALIAASNLNVTIPNPGMTDGAVSLDLIGGTAPYTISWSGPNGFTSSNEDISNLAAGDYVLNVTDAHGCTFTETYAVKPAFSALATATPSCGNDGCINLIVAGGVPPFQVSWNGGSFISDDNDISICTFAKGVYNVSVADNAGNVFDLGAVNVPGLQPALVSPNVSDPVQDFGNGSVILSAVPDTVVMTYSWSGPNGFTSTSNAIMNRDSGVYVVTVTNTNSGCTSVYNFHLLRQWPPVDLTAGEVLDPNCLNSADGGINLNITGGNPPYEYNWAGPNGFSATTKNINGLVAGDYTVTVTDQNDSINILNITLDPMSLLAVTNVNELSNYGGFQVSGVDNCDGIANVVFTGASGTASILWSNGVTTATNETLCAGDYMVTVTDNLGCTAVWSDALTAPPAIDQATQIVSEISCHGECDGIARVVVFGGKEPYTVKWSTGQIDQVPVANAFSQAVNLCGGDYSVTVTDVLGGSKVFTIPVPEPDPLTIVFDELIPQSFNSCDGELIATASSNNGPFSYIWSGSLGHSGDGQRAEGLCAGEIIQFIVQDAFGCIGIGIDTIDYPDDGCLQVRPVITPGEQDGNNDFLYISCIETLPNSIEIYNRWGQLVYQATGYDNSGTRWEGTNKSGQPLAEGVYFYVLNFTDPNLGAQQRKGHINLLR